MSGGQDPVYVWSDEVGNVLSLRQGSLDNRTEFLTESLCSEIESTTPSGRGVLWKASTKSV